MSDSNEQTSGPVSEEPAGQSAEEAPATPETPQVSEASETCYPAILASVTLRCASGSSYLIRADGTVGVDTSADQPVCLVGFQEPGGPPGQQPRIDLGVSAFFADPSRAQGALIVVRRPAATVTELIDGSPVVSAQPELWTP